MTLGRPEFKTIWLRLAEDLALRSTCGRKQVGCVVVSADNRQVLSMGYNGNAPGLPNRCDDANVSGRCGCIHAEANAVFSCRESRTTLKAVYVSVAPCLMCAKALLQLGNVRWVVYRKAYRDHAGTKLLQKQGINTEKVS